MDFSHLWRSLSSFELFLPKDPRLAKALIASGAAPSMHWACAIDTHVCTWALPDPIIPQSEKALNQRLVGRKQIVIYRSYPNLGDP